MLFFRFKTGSFREKKLFLNVHGKFLKMYKSFSNFSMVHAKSLKLNFVHDDIPEIETFEIFDFIPYLMIENAVKYSPSYGHVEIELRIYGSNLIATVGNMGPLLYNDEINRVFDREFRGENAKKSKETGQGLGLFHLKDALFELDIGSVKT